MDSAKSDKDNFKICIKIMRKLVSDIQGAPYPGENFEPELYRIWYEHVQKAAVECFQFLDLNYPPARSDYSQLDKFLDS